MTLLIYNLLTVIVTFDDAQFSKRFEIINAGGILDEQESDEFDIEPKSSIVRIKALNKCYSKLKIKLRNRQ